jgi:hypothetical protein
LAEEEEGEEKKPIIDTKQPENRRSGDMSLLLCFIDGFPAVLEESPLSPPSARNTPLETILHSLGRFDAEEVEGVLDDLAGFKAILQNGTCRSSLVSEYVPELNA